MPATYTDLEELLRLLDLAYEIIRRNYPLSEFLGPDPVKSFLSGYEAVKAHRDNNTE